MINQLIKKTNAVKDRKDEYHFTCPVCGKESSPQKPHCSFSTRGWFCFVCGSKGSIKQLAKMIGVEAEGYTPPPVPTPDPAKPAYWMGNPVKWLTKYEGHPDRFDLWKAYKPISTRTIVKHRLGVGILPSSKCKHDRLIVPILYGSMLVGLRGRRIACNCAKWLTPGGTRLEFLPLYNQDALYPSCIVLVVENPVDALLITQQTDYVGVATYSTAYWREEWSQVLDAAKPGMVVVAYDNDLPGNGGGPRRGEFIAKYMQDHTRTPPAKGVDLVNKLLKTGTNALLFDWGRAEYKTDFGSLLCT